MDEEDESDQAEHAGSPDKAQVGEKVYCMCVRACMCPCMTLCVYGSPDKAQVDGCVCVCMCVRACMYACVTVHV